MKTVVFDNQEYQLSDEGNTRDLAGQILGDDYRKVLGGKVKNENLSPTAKLWILSR